MNCGNEILPSYPFGSSMMGRASKSGDYRYGFGGHEKDDEVKGEGNHLAFGDYGYDTRLGRRWNIDPFVKKYPFQSSYSGFNNNPILYEDPSGQSGVAAIDKSAKIITIHQTIILYGSKADSQLAKNVANDIQNAWNAAHGTVMINGEMYNVEFKIQGRYMKEEGGGWFTKSNVEKEIDSNPYYVNNYYRVEDKTNDDRGGSYVSSLGSNSGEFQYGQIKNSNTTTEPHEDGHALGLDHDMLSNGNEKKNYKGEGQPHIMVMRGAVVDKEYTASWGTINAEKRIVTQKNIDDLHLEKLKFDNKGRAPIGKVTNKYYDKAE